MSFQEQLEKATDESIKTIGNYLIDRAKADINIAQNLEKENKSLEKCYQFIVNNAEKQKYGNSAMVGSDAVFGWAVHYYDEDDLEIVKKVEQKKEVMKKSVAKESTLKKEEQNDTIDSAFENGKSFKKAKPVAKKDEKTSGEQLSLF